MPKINNLHDTYIWSLTSNGEFTTRSAYLLGISESVSDVDGSYSWIWKLPLPARWCVFIWLTWRDRLVTNLFRFNRGMADSAGCVLCGCPV